MTSSVLLWRRGVSVAARALLVLLSLAYVTLYAAFYLRLAFASEVA